MRYMAQYCLRRSVVSFPMFNLKKAAYYTATPTPTPTLVLDEDTREGYKTLRESQGFANDLLLSRHAEAVSPSSFHLIILSLLTAGSGGFSRDQFLRFFDVDSLCKLDSSVSLLQDVLLADRPDSSFGPRIRSSTSLWHHHSLSLHPCFLDTLCYPHEASIFPVEFYNTPLARQQINSRVEYDTNGHIKDLMYDGSLGYASSVKLVLTNTLHFKGDWDINPNNCLGYDYHWYNDLDERFVGAEIITVCRNIIFEEEDDVPHLTLGNKFRRPSKDKRHVNLTYCYPIPMHTDDDDDDDASGYSIPNETLMEVAGREIPKFNVSSEVDASYLTLPFPTTRLTEMLAPLHSDLSGELYLFKMLQKTFIDLNEQGGEAAMATTAIIMEGCPTRLLNPFFIDRKCYESNLFDVANGSMARVGLQVLQHM